MRDLVDISGDAESWCGRECAATPHNELIAELLNSSVPKTEREHAAAREIGLLEDALKIYKADRDFAHRLAVMLECALLDRIGTWGAAHALLDEYRGACRDAHGPQTLMGEPVGAHVECGHCGGFGEVTGEYPGVMCPKCYGTGYVTANT